MDRLTEKMVPSLYTERNEKRLLPLAPFFATRHGALETVIPHEY